MKASAAARLDPTDHAILAMRVAGDSPVEIATRSVFPSDCETHRRDRLKPGTRRECSVTFVLALLLTRPRILSARNLP
jgi:hypothetical protein